MSNNYNESTKQPRLSIPSWCRDCLDPGMVNRAVFDAYQRECERLANYIRSDLPSNGRDDPLNGRAWCEKYDVPPKMFADTVTHHLEEVNYSGTPMYPWKDEDDE